MKPPGGARRPAGIAGLTLGGGIGWLTRKYGATVDSLLAVDLVTAAGELVTASADENPDLFWGIRGGGGNFGVVTSFEYRLHPVGPTVLAGPVFHPLEDPREVLAFYREFIAGAPDELTTIFNLRAAPPLPSLPEEVHGKPIVMVGACYAGAPADGIEVVRPLKEFGTPIVDLSSRSATRRCSRCSTGPSRTAGTTTGSRSSCRRSHGDRQYERLVELNRSYDPTNFFRLNQNIEP